VRERGFELRLRRGLRDALLHVPEIVLSTLNARFIHTAFGLRYLMANLGELQPRAGIAEFDINQRPLEIVEAILARDPRIVGFGVYIWNAMQTCEVVALLKRLRPQIIVILGGPEVSHETEQQEIVRLADYVITGEADVKFAEVCRALLGVDQPATDGQTLARSATMRSATGSPPANSQPSTLNAQLLPKIIPAELPALDRLAPPYELYTDADIAHRVLYVEASRGCPFTCEFCLSSLDVPVRAFPLEPFLAALDRLLARGARQFKFVDRTFNLNLNTSRAILEFFIARWRDGLFVHFEMVPDRLPEPLREAIAKFPPGALQFEVGIQTFDDATSRNISRRQNYPKLEENLRYLRERTGVHVHADLIVGLPGESVESFARGFDRLVALRPQEIQVGILKRLRGTPIVRHDAEWGMIYSPNPPYEILENKLIGFATMQRLRRFARFWDLVGNSGNFVETVPLIWDGGESPFWSFLRFSDWLGERMGRHHSIALATLAENLFVFLTGERTLENDRVAEALASDWRRGGRKENPPFFERNAAANSAPASLPAPAAPKRQARHLAGTK
jgi:radical SAM superfamily enzyme YgiQ (UPF0313 family)